MQDTFKIKGYIFEGSLWGQEEHTERFVTTKRVLAEEAAVKFAAEKVSHVIDLDDLDDNFDPTLGSISQGFGNMTARQIELILRAFIQRKPALDGLFSDENPFASVLVSAFGTSKSRFGISEIEIEVDAASVWFGFKEFKDQIEENLDAMTHLISSGKAVAE